VRRSYENLKSEAEREIVELEQRLTVRDHGLSSTPDSTSGDLMVCRSF